MAIPSSRSEEILRKTIDGEEYTGLPNSRVEALLIELNHGGGGGTTDYNALENRPTINGNIVEGEIADDIVELIEPLTPQDEKDIDDIITDDPNGNH